MKIRLFVISQMNSESSDNLAYYYLWSDDQLDRKY